MPSGIIAKKVGMTQIFDDGGACVPVTVLQAGPCVVVDVRTPERDGYQAAQLGMVESRPDRRVNRPMKGHFAKAGVPAMRRLREFPISSDECKAGDQVLVHETFQAGDKVHVTGVSKGKGFQGVMKRHNFSGGRATHGSMFHRAPGSVGASSYPSRTFPGTRLPGQMGAKRITTKNLTVVRVDETRNLLLVKGAVPGANGGYLMIRKAGS